MPVGYYLHEADAQMYSLTYEPLDGQGMVITTPSEGVTEW